MAARSYLSRIAEPLVPGQPVLTTRPRQVLDDQSPPLTIPPDIEALRPSRPPAPDARGPVAATATMQPPAAAAPMPLVPPIQDADETTRTLSPNTSADVAAPNGKPFVTENEIAEPRARAGRAPRQVADRTFAEHRDADGFAPDNPTPDRTTPDRTIPDSELPASARQNPWPIGANAELEPRPLAATVSRLATPAYTGTAEDPAPPAGVPRADAAGPREIADARFRQPEPIDLLPPATEYRATPRIHIGTVEVRVVSPPVAIPQPTPQAVAAPGAPRQAAGSTPLAGTLARPLGFHYGLVQS